MFDAAHHEEDWENFINTVPACAGSSSNDSFACLRAASVDDIINAGNIALAVSAGEFPFAPVIDGPNGIIPDLPSELFAQGHFAKIPLLAGQNLDEGESTIVNEYSESC